MTERLSTLLHDEADHLAVPAPPTERVLRRGQGLRRRRRIGTGIAVVAAVAVVTAGAGYGVARLGQDGGDAVEPAGPATGHGAVFTLGTTVFWDGGTASAQIDDRAIKSTYYTSAGLLVRHGDNNWSDGGGEQRFSLVTEDGTVHDVSVVTEDVVPGVDPTQPYLAYAEVTDGTVEVVVHDVATDEEVARVRVPEARKWGGWSAPPVALHGDTVYVGTDDTARTVDWRTGEVATTDAIDPGYPSIRGGRTTGRDGDRATVSDVATGEVLLSVPAGRYGYLALSPDGRYATLDEQDGTAVEVFDVADGSSVTLEGQAWDFGWSPDGDLFKVVDRHVLTCSTDTGECTEGDVTLPRQGGGVAPQDLRYGDRAYES